MVYEELFGVPNSATHDPSTSSSLAGRALISRNSELLGAAWEESKNSDAPGAAGAEDFGT